MMNKLLEDTRQRGGVYCVQCGLFFNDIIDTRKHNVEQHYYYECDCTISYRSPYKVFPNQKPFV